MRPTKRFLYCLQNAANGTIPYVDSNNVMQITTSMSGQRIWLNSSPAGWRDNEVSFGQNDTYLGINRSYTDPLTFFNDGKKIINNLFYNGKGYEQRINLIILEWNPDTDVYELYYKGLIDLSTKEEQAGQGVQVSTMEGGVIGLLKEQDKTIFQIPCDGSIKENIKINFDGTYLPDNLYYEFIKVGLPLNSLASAFYAYSIPSVFQGNDGDNFGIAHGNPTFADVGFAGVAPYNLYVNTSANNLFFSDVDIKLTIKGTITTSGSCSNRDGGFVPRFALVLVPELPFVNFRNPAIWLLTNCHTETGDVFYFETTFVLPAQTPLFMFIYEYQFSQINVLGGSFQISFYSKPQDTRCWGITAYDLFKKIVEKMNLASSTMEQVFNYAANSTLLQENLNFVVTSGDALAASGDPNFQKFYNAVQINPNFPSQVISYSYGPVIKISLSDFFKRFSINLFGALSNEQIKIINYPQVTASLKTIQVTSANTLIIIGAPASPAITAGMYINWVPNGHFGIHYLITAASYDSGTSEYTLTVVGPLPAVSVYSFQNYIIESAPVTSVENESLFFESVNTVLDPTLDPSKLISLGEVSSMKVTEDNSVKFNKIKAGYAPIEYDQKAGKFEWNTTLEMLAPAKSVQKYFDLTGPGRADSYGMERKRANISGTSQTRNSGDSDWFIVNTDRDKQSFDFWDANFLSIIPDFDTPNNTNQILIPAVNTQAVTMSKFNGSFLSVNNDPSIFIFNQTGSASRSLVLSIAGTLAGNLANAVLGTSADYFILTLYKNSAVLFTQTITKTGLTPADVFNIAPAAIVGAIGFKDVLYVRVTTSVGATVTINSGSLLSVDGAYFTAQTESPVVIESGLPLQLLPFTLVNTTKVTINGIPRDIVSFGFQYFTYNTSQLQNNYDYAAIISSITRGSGGGDSLVIDLFYNGLSIGTAVNTGTDNVEVPFTNNFSGNKTLALGDLFFILASNSDELAEITGADFKLTSTEIIAYGLKRVLYDSISGVPNIVPSDQPGAPYNIEDLRPWDIISKWGPWIRGVLYPLVPGDLQFSTQSHNQFLSTTYQDVTKTDNAARSIGSLGNPLFYPILFEVGVNVPATFAKQKDIVVNQHVSWTWNGVPYYGFCRKMTKKATLNEPQKWLFRASPANDLQNLIDLDFDGLKLISLMSNEIFASRLCPLQIVPLNPTFDGRFHYRPINSTLFKQTLREYHQKSSCYIPVQNNDGFIPLQIFSGSISPITVNLYTCDASLVSSTELTEIAMDALKAPMKCFEGNIDISTLDEGKYYLTVTPGTSGAVFTTEKIWVKEDWPDTVFIQYKHSVNKLSMIFSTGYAPQMRVHGTIDDYTPYDRATEYEDEPANIQMIDGIPYDTTRLYLGYSSAVPDWVIQKMNFIMLLDTTVIEGVQWSRNGADAKWEKNATPGNPLKYWSLEIREAKNSDGISGLPSDDTSDILLVYNIENSGFGSDSGDTTVTQVTETA